MTDLRLRDLDLKKVSMKGKLERGRADEDLARVGSGQNSRSWFGLDLKPGPSLPGISHSDDERLQRWHH